jgi:glutathione peroxidase
MIGGKPMRIAVSALILTTVFLAASRAVAPSAAADMPAAAAPTAACPAWLNQEYRKLHSSQKVNLCQAYAGRPLLIVNTASHCGFTPQFKGLEAAHQKYKQRGLVLVGFASDDFNQEDADEGKAAEICFLNNGVTFTMLAPTHVKGKAANPVFLEMARQTKAPSWNFNKYLVRADGRVLQHMGSNVEPESAQFAAVVEALLK